jgi:ParB family chromosome partitioning protein
MKRKALGKGLRSLIPEASKRRTAPAVTSVETAAPTASETSDPGLRQIDVDRIWPNPNQPRKEFDDVALHELAQSMKRDGLIQPVVVRPARESGQYELIAGERRWRAAQVAGLLKVPAIVREVADDRLLELALIENLQREDLNPVEAAMAFRTLIDEMGMTQQEVGERVGKERASIANLLRILHLPAAVRDRIKTGDVSVGHAKVLLSVANTELQRRLAERIASEGLTVRQLEAIVKRLGSGVTASAPARSVERDPNVVAAEEQLQRVLGTKVAIVPGKKGGRLEIHYYSDEELVRLYELVMKSVQ